MDFFTIIIIGLTVIGAALVLRGAFLRENNGLPAARTYGRNLPDIDERLNTLETTVSEADEAAVALDGMSKNVFKELDDKYQSLLFLYNLIDDKEKNVNASEAKSVRSATAPFDPLSQLVTRKTGVNPKYDIVFKMRAAGKSPDEIAKELKMGKGQVSLILNLGGGSGA